jgi:hypothetical protein
VKTKMKKTIAGFAILFGTLAIFAALNKPDINDPDLWKGCPSAVYRPAKPDGPGPVPTPIMVAEQKADHRPSDDVAIQAGGSKLVAVK